MSDWEISLLIGIALTFVLIGILALLGRLEEKKIRDQRRGAPESPLLRMG